MKICLIGGIYGKGGQRSAYVHITPETTLETGLRAAGHEVTTLSHYDDVDFSPFDLVHVHHLSYGAARLAADTSPTPFVYTNHDASQMCGARLSLPRRLALQYTLSRADAVVALSESEARFQRRTYDLEGARHVVIPNGINADRYAYSRRNHAGQSHPWNLLLVGQLIPLKGHDLLFRALAGLSHPVELHLAYQNDTLESELRDLARQLHIAPRVHFHGKREPHQLAELYAQSDLLVLPSETEALPSVITEAMLTGLPFIASAVGGIVDQAHGYGFLVTQRTVESWRLHLSYVLDRYSHFAAQSRSMSDYARRTFAIPAMIQSHLDLYSAVAGQPARRTAKQTSGVDALARHAVRQWGRRGHPALTNQPVTATERL